MKVEEVIARVLGVPVAVLNETSGPATLRGWSSLKHIQLMAALEETYGVLFTTGEMQRLTSVAQVRTLLCKKGVEM